MEGTTPQRDAEPAQPDAVNKRAGTDSGAVTPKLLALSPRTAARSLGVGHDAIYQLLGEGRLRSVKVGRRRLIPIRELERFLAEELA